MTYYDIGYRHAFCALWVTYESNHTGGLDCLEDLLRETKGTVILEEVWDCIEVVGIETGTEVLSEADTDESLYELSGRSKTNDLEKI